jgi:hypothetical protein
LILIAASSVRAQLQNATNIVQTPTPGSGHDYFKMLNETVNPASGELSIRISVPTPPGRQLTLPFSFAYDSGSAFHVESSLVAGEAEWSTNRRYMAEGGWSYSIPVVTANPMFRPSSTDKPPRHTCVFISNYMFEDPSGGQHALQISPVDTIQSDCAHALLEIPQPVLLGGDDFVRAGTTGGTGAYPEFSPVSVADADGTTYAFNMGTLTVDGGLTYAAVVASITNRNGNSITNTGGSGGEARSLTRIRQTAPWCRAGSTTWADRGTPSPPSGALPTPSIGQPSPIC